MSATIRNEGSMFSAYRFIPHNSLHALAGLAVVAAELLEPFEKRVCVQAGGAGAPSQPPARTV